MAEIDTSNPAAVRVWAMNLVYAHSTTSGSQSLMEEAEAITRYILDGIAPTTGEANG